MVAWHSAFLVCLAFSLATVVQRGKEGGGARDPTLGALRPSGPVVRMSDLVPAPRACGVAGLRVVGRACEPGSRGG